MVRNSPQLFLIGSICQMLTFIKLSLICLKWIFDLDQQDLLYLIATALYAAFTMACIYFSMLLTYPMFIEGTDCWTFLKSYTNGV